MSSPHPSEATPEATSEGLDDLIAHLERSTRLSREEAMRVVEEVLAYFAESAPDYVVRRHGALRETGLSNAAIYARISRDLETRRFRGPALSERQIRRLIYG